MIQVEKIKAIIDKSPNLTAFGRVRTAELTMQIDAKQLHDSLPLFYDQDINVGDQGTASITHSTTNAESTLTVNGDSVDGVQQHCIMQTKQRFNYQTGKGVLGFMTFRQFQNQTGVTKRVGYYNSDTTGTYNTGLILEFSAL